MFIEFIPFLHSLNNVNTNHSISGGKLWKWFFVGKDMFVALYSPPTYMMMSSGDIICVAILLYNLLY